MSDTTSDSSQIQPTITFNEIPSNLQVPGNYVEVAANYQNIGVLPLPARALIIGQRAGALVAAAKGKAGVVYPIYRADQGPALFGAGTMVADQLNAWFEANPGIPVDAVGLVAPGAGASTSAAGSITFGGAATVVGPQAFGMAGNRVVFAISPGDTPATMAANFIAAAAAIGNAPNWPVGFATNSTAGQVAITANSQGVAGNQYDIRPNPAQRDTTVPGVTIAVTPMAGGVGTPDITGVLSTIASTWYTEFFVGWNDSTTMGILNAELGNRYQAMETMDGHAYFCWIGTQGQIAAQASGFDSQFASAVGFTNPQQPSWVIAATLGGVAARNLMNDPSRQLRGLALPGIIAPARVDRMYEPEQQALLIDGVATYSVAPDDTVLIQRLVTTYTQSPLGVPDSAWQDIMVPKTLTRIRYDWKNYLTLVYPRNKLADDGSLAAEYDNSVVTCKRLKGAWAARCNLYGKLGWIENIQATVNASTFVRDVNNRNQVNTQLNIQIIGNLMVTAQQLLFDV